MDVNYDALARKIKLERLALIKERYEVLILKARKNIEKEVGYEDDDDTQPAVETSGLVKEAEKQAEQPIGQLRGAGPNQDFVNQAACPKTPKIKYHTAILKF